MNTRILLFIVLGLCASSLLAQEEPGDDRVDFDDLEKFSSGYFQVGINHYIPVGSSYVKDGYSFGVGGDFQYNQYLFKDFLIAFQYNWNNADIEDMQVTGNYTSSAVSNFGFAVGYRFRVLKDFELTPKIGAGEVSHHNKQGSIDSNDSGTYYHLGTDVAYNFTKRWSFYTNGQYRISKMDIAVDGSRNNYFNSIPYFIMSFGIRLRIY